MKDLVNWNQVDHQVFYLRMKAAQLFYAASGLLGLIATELERPELLP